jgi:hypothetical protein
MLAHSRKFSFPIDPLAGAPNYDARAHRLQHSTTVEPNPIEAIESLFLAIPEGALPGPFCLGG